MKLEDHWKPNLFVAGFSKCGTTALCDYLSQHPDIYVIKGKEPCTLIMDFIDDIKFYPKVWNKNNFTDYYIPLPFCNYKSLYQKNSTKKIRVDGSTPYTYKVYFASIIKEFNPSAKVILCIREQNERLISLYRFTYPFHRFPFNKWLDNVIHCINEYLFYEHIVEYEALFNKNLLIIDQKTLRHNPQYALEKVFGFLDLKPIVVKPIISNPNYIDPFDNSYKNVLISYYILLHTKISKIIRRYKLYDSIIHKLLIGIRSETIDNIFNNAKSAYEPEKSVNMKKMLMSKIPNDLKQLLDEDYKRTVDFCKAKNILLE